MAEIAASQIISHDVFEVVRRAPSPLGEGACSSDGFFTFWRWRFGLLSKNIKKKERKISKSPSKVITYNSTPHVSTRCAVREHTQCSYLSGNNLQVGLISPKIDLPYL